MEPKRTLTWSTSTQCRTQLLPTPKGPKGLSIARFPRFPPAERHQRHLPFKASPQALGEPGLRFSSHHPAIRNMYVCVCGL